MTAVPSAGPDLDCWFDEFSRLVSEARDRYDNGEVIAALASLAAVPMVHQVLVDRCGALTEERPDPEQGTGLYL